MEGDGATAWGIITKHFNDQDMHAFEWVFKVMTADDASILTLPVFEQYLAGMNIDEADLPELVAIYRACSNERGEMSVSGFLNFIYQVQIDEYHSKFAHNLKAEAEEQFFDRGLDGDSDFDDDEEEEERQLQISRQAKLAAKLEDAKEKALAQNDYSALQPYFPRLFEQYTPPTQGERPLLEDGLMILVHALADFEYDVRRVQEKMDAMLQSLEQSRAQEDAAREKYKDVFTEEEIENYINQFRAVDEDGSGQIDETELGKIFSSIGVEVEPKKLQLMFQQVDEDGSGEVDLDEYMGMLKRVADGDDDELTRILIEAAKQAEIQRKKEEQEKREARAVEASRRAAVFRKFTKKQIETFQTQFNEFDADGSGEIDFAEMKAMVHGLGMVVKDSVLRKLMAEIDIDGGGTLSFVEFLEMMDKGKSGKLGELFSQISNRQQNMNNERRKQIKREQARMQRKKEELKLLRGEKSRLRAWALQNLTKKEIKGLQRGFEAIDIDGSDSVDEEELRMLLKHLDISMSTDELRALIEEVDIDQSGALDFTEFLVLAAKAKDSGKNAAAFQAIVEAQSRASQTSNIREELERMKLNANEERLSSSLARESLARDRQKKLVQNEAKKKRMQNLNRLKVVETRQSQLTNETNSMLKRQQTQLSRKQKEAEKQLEKVQKAKQLELDKQAKKRNERAAQALKKANELKFHALKSK